MIDSSLEADAQALRTAMKGWGTDESALIRLTTSRTNAQRMKIRQAFATAFGRDLLKDLDSELSGHLKEAMLAMWRSPIEFDAIEIFYAVKGMGTNEDVLNEIIGSRSNYRLTELKKVYKNLFGEDLDERIRGETSGHYEKLLISLLQAKRDESKEPNQTQIEQDVNDLFNAGENKWGTDEDIFNRIFALRSPTHLYFMNKHYQSKFGKDLLAVIDSEFSGNLKLLLQTILHAHISPADYFAHRIYSACKGWGTNDRALIRVIITIDEAFLAEVKNLYPSKYKMTLEDQIRGETSGDYQTLLLEIIKN